MVGHAYLARCTGDFAASRVIGAGGFGTVYRAVDAALGARFAVKRLRAGGGEAGERSAEREVALLSRFRSHPNIVRMLGYTAADACQPRCVLYELLDRGGLDAHLRDPARATALSWPLRLRYAAGLARALAFLHRGQSMPAFHRDVKAANVALAADWTPKLVDCGLSKLFSDDELAAQPTGASVAAPGYDVVFGTQGYRCSVYETTGKYSEKSECFSFGVVLLELLTGRSSEVSKTNAGGLAAHFFDIGEEALCETRDARLAPGWDAGAASTLEALAQRCTGPYRARPPMVAMVRELAALEAEHAAGEGEKAHAAELAAAAAAHLLTADAEELAVLAARRTCQACTDDELPLAGGLECCGDADGAHFYCFACLSQIALAKAGPQLAHGLRCAGRLGGDARCTAAPYAPLALARGLSAAALEALQQAALLAQKAALEHGFRASETALRQRLAEAEARAGACEALRLHVAETMLTPKCPRCAHAFIGFAGCFALRCAPDDAQAGAAEWAAGFCGAAFCAWCFEDCGDDAHAHVRACPHNAARDRGYFGTVQAFDGGLRALRLRRLAAYLPTLEPQLRKGLLAALRTDLADLGLDAAAK